MALALKEWPAAIQALGSGKMILLFRKGGIHEKSFEADESKGRFFLFPSFAHQNNQNLKVIADPPEPNYQPGAPIAIASWLELHDVIKLNDADIIPALSNYHIWTDEYLYQRYQWKPERPLLCLLCRNYRLDRPVTIPYQAQYDGCRSWIELEQDLDFFPCTAAITDRDFEQKAETIRHLLNA